MERDDLRHGTWGLRIIPDAERDDRAAHLLASRKPRVVARAHRVVVPRQQRRARSRRAGGLVLELVDDDLDRGRPRRALRRRLVVPRGGAVPRGRRRLDERARDEARAVGREHERGLLLEVDLDARDAVDALQRVGDPRDAVAAHHRRDVQLDRSAAAAVRRGRRRAALGRRAEADRLDRVGERGG